MAKEFKNTINIVREDVHICSVDKTSTPVLLFGGAFLLPYIGG